MSNSGDSSDTKPTSTEEILTKNDKVEEGVGAVKDDLARKDHEELVTSTKPEAAQSGDAPNDDADEPVPPGHHARGRTSNAASGVIKPPSGAVRPVKPVNVKPVEQD